MRPGDEAQHAVLLREHTPDANQVGPLHVFIKQRLYILVDQPELPVLR